MMTAVTYMMLGLLAYGGFVVATTLLAQPFRVKLVELCEDVLSEPNLSADDRDDLEWMMASSTNGSIGLLIPISALLALAEQVLAGPRTETRIRAKKLQDDPRYAEIFACYVLSIMACSPVATLLSVPIMIVTIGIAMLRGNRELVRVAERPVMAASAQMRPC